MGDMCTRFSKECGMPRIITSIMRGMYTRFQKECDMPRIIGVIMRGMSHSL